MSAVLLCACAKKPVSDKTGAGLSDAVPGTVPSSVTDVNAGTIAFLTAPGCYAEEFTLEIEASAGYRILYTTDGSSPLDSDSALEYTGGIPVKDRRGEKNVVSAVDTALYDAANVTVNGKRNGFNTSSKNPSDDAVDKCTVIRAAGIAADGSATEVIGGTWFIGNVEDHVRGAGRSSAASKAAGMGDTLAVISIVGDYDSFFDYETGIYVKGKVYDEAVAEAVANKERLTADTSRKIAANYNQKGREWERRVHIDFFETDGTTLVPVMSRDCGIRIQGNYSRSDLQKGFRLYARAEYGDKNFMYPVFGNASLDDEGKTIEKYKTLILRNGGNCAFTTKYSADYWAYLAKDTKADTLASRPAAVYLNGEYWGLYVLEEDYTDNYFENKHGVDNNSVVLYKGDAEALALGYKLDIGDIPDGEDESYYFEELLEFFASHSSLESDADYNEFCKLVDPESVRDYFAVEAWINNKWDWPGKNWSMWRTAAASERGAKDDGAQPDADNPYADGRWRFCFYDLEFGGVSGAADAGVNTIREDNYKTYGLLDTDTSNPAVLCFAYCMTNAGFREDFYAELNHLSDTVFEKSRAHNVLEAMNGMYEPLYNQFFERYPGTGSAKNSISGGYASKKCISDFLNKRYGKISSMITWCEKHYN